MAPGTSSTTALPESQADDEWSPAVHIFDDSYIVEDFFGRSGVLTELEGFLQPGKSGSPEVKTYSICGFGGIGTFRLSQSSPTVDNVRENDDRRGIF